MAGLELRLKEGTAIWPWSLLNFGGHQGHQAGHQGQMFLYGRAQRPFLKGSVFGAMDIQYYPVVVESATHRRQNSMSFDEFKIPLTKPHTS